MIVRGNHREGESGLVSRKSLRFFLSLLLLLPLGERGCFSFLFFFFFLIRVNNFTVIVRA